MQPAVYTLSDPRTGEVRYVGQTSRSLRLRLTEHIQDVKRSRRYSSNWIKSLLADGVEPLIELAEMCLTQEACDAAEQFYIDYFRFLGFRLTNLTDGGKATRNVVITNKMRETARRTHLGVRRSAATCAKISTSKIGIKLPPRSAEYKAKLSVALTGRIFSEETKAKMSRSRGGRPVVHVASGQRFETASVAARAFGLIPQGVSQTASGRIRHTGGHVFKFTEAV